MWENSLEDNKLHIRAFYLRKLWKIKIDSKIDKKEHLGSLDSFYKCCHYLEDTSNVVIIYSNQNNFKYFVLVHILNYDKAL